nr:MAG TPA: hypothetical protein [Caudoviricetes sp.]
MICAYALYQEEPDLESASDAVAIAFELLRPVLDKAKERSESGKKGGSKPEANAKQTVSKPEANAKQGKAASKKEKEVENEVEIDNITPSEFCGELPSSPPPAAVLPLVDGTDFEISVETVAELSGLYPAVNVEQQLRNMRGWLWANPKNRKTKAGIMRFVNSWLSREQNSARPASSQATGGRYGKPDIPKGASGELGKAELEAIQRVLAQE